jgi:ADP-ribosyl-[dinitrogen reductase] hydrolase
MNKYIDYKRRYLKLKGGNHDKKDLIKGAIWGTIVGDALGSRYEFLEHYEATEQIKKDMDNNNKLKILGGGPFNLLAGQVSDDSEMTLCLLQALSFHKKYDQATSADNYIKWFNTSPPDIGLTIKRALKTRKISSNNNDMVENSNSLNSFSLSNGVLMRISPLGVYGIFIDDDDLKEYVNKECDLTHPNEIIKDASYIYCIAIKYLILNKERSEVFNLCYSLAMTPRLKIILETSKNRPEPVFLITEKDEKFIHTDDKQFQGYFGIALQNAFYELMNGKSFYDSMIEIIKRGGDTDTNCAIAGGLLGAFYGYKNINPDWITTIKNTNRGIDFVSPSRADEYIDELMMIDK